MGVAVLFYGAWCRSYPRTAKLDLGGHSYTHPGVEAAWDASWDVETSQAVALAASYSTITPRTVSVQNESGSSPGGIVNLP